MRQEPTVQASIFDLFADHEIGRELKAARGSGWKRRARPSSPVIMCAPWRDPLPGWRSQIRISRRFAAMR